MRFLQYTSQRTRYIMVAMLALAVLAGTTSAQVTTSSLNIGGPGALGCSVPAVDPTTLDDGVPASAQITYTFNSLTQVLILTVTNTSEVVPGVPNPVITKMYVNLPQLAIANAVLVSQVGAPSGAVPNFSLGLDLDNTDELGSLFGSCFGKFGLVLEVNTVQGAIANAQADTLPGPATSMVIGPAIFTIQLTGSSSAISSLVAEAFAHAFSVNNPGDMQATAAFKFQGGGVTSSGGWLGAAPASGGGSPAGWVVGTPSAGNTLTLVQSGHPGWEGCFIAATTPGPICIDGNCYPIGPDWFPVFGGILPPNGFISLNLVVPNPPEAPEIGTITFYAIVALASPDQRIISVSEQFSIAIDF